VSI
ncbi:hypothetical protein CP02DC21_0711B, partial [Chlamydia psittaci 02DC21]|jgi:hypothetical protein